MLDHHNGRSSSFQLETRLVQCLNPNLSLSKNGSASGSTALPFLTRPLTARPARPRPHSTISALNPIGRLFADYKWCLWRYVVSSTNRTKIKAVPFPERSLYIGISYSLEKSALCMFMPICPQNFLPTLVNQIIFKQTIATFALFSC